MAVATVISTDVIGETHRPEALWTQYAVQDARSQQPDKHDLTTSNSPMSRDCAMLSIGFAECLPTERATSCTRHTDISERQKTARLAAFHGYGSNPIPGV
jgi:hypothetical protein